MTITAAILTKQEKLREIEKRQYDEKLKEEKRIKEEADKELEKLKSQRKNLPSGLPVNKAAADKNQKLLEQNCLRAKNAVATTERQLTLIESDKYPVDLKKIRVEMTEDDKPYTLT